MAQASRVSPRCLVVEDEVLIGMDLEDVLCAAGFNVEWATSAQRAAEVLAGDHFDVAVLDVVMRSEPCVPLARELKRRGIPFLVHSGRPRDRDLIGFRGAPWLDKPAEAGTLLAALTAVMGTAEPAPRDGMEAALLPTASSPGVSSRPPQAMSR